MPRFIEKEDCYLDTKTGLEWEKTDRGGMTWHEAMEIKDGWRLPTKKELTSLFRKNKNKVPFTKLFGIRASYYWSSTTNVGNPDYAWFVYFSYGYVYYGFKSSYYSVRCVRG